MTGHNMALSFCALLLVAQSTAIEDGIPLSGELPDKGSEFFNFTLTETKPNEDVYLFLTSYSDFSNPDLYVSSNKHPTIEDYDFKSNEFGIDQVLIPHTRLRLGTYYILVYCETKCTYTLTYSYSKRIFLVPEIPVYLSIEQKKTWYFNYTVTEECKEGVSVELHPLSPSFKMSVTSTNFTDLVTEDTWDSGYICYSQAVQDDEFEIIVYSDQRSEYMIVLSCQEGIQIPASKLMNGVVRYKEMKYYKVSVKQLDGPFKVISSLVSGDPDLYIQYDKKPTTNEYAYAANDYGQDSITVNKILGEWIYIGVYGYRDTDFTVILKTNQAGSTLLIPGDSVSGVVEEESVDLYSLDIPGYKNLTISISLQMISGNPDIFAKLCPLHSCDFTEEELAYPEEYDYIYYSNFDVPLETLEIQHVSGLCNRVCQYIIAVKGTSEVNSNYVLRASYGGDTELVLREGSPTQGQVTAENPLFYRFFVEGSMVESVVFQLDTESGDANLYVSRLELFPDHDTAEKYSESSGIISDTVSFYKEDESKDLKGVYHIAVRSEMSSIFRLTAVSHTNNTNSVIKLLPGVTMQGTLRNKTDEEYKFYAFNLDYPEGYEEDIKIRIKPILGSVELYVTNTADPIKDDTFTYIWKIDEEIREEKVLEIKSTDPNFKAKAVYTLCVIGASFVEDLASYSISHMNKGSIKILAEGDVLVDRVEEKSYNYYAWFVPSVNDQLQLFISMLPYQGNPDLYITIADSNPTETNYDYKSSRYGNETVIINYMDIKEKCPGECWVYISSYGITTAEYGIVVTSSAIYSPILITPNKIISGGVAEEEIRYYYLVVERDQNLEIRVEIFLGNSDLVMNLQDVDLNASPSTWTLPTSEESDYIRRSPQFDNYINLSADDIKIHCDTDACVAVVGIHCFDPMCQFSLSAVQEGYVVVTDDRVVEGSVRAKEYNYYVYEVIGDIEQILMILTSYGGTDPDIFVSLDKLPTMKDYDWSEESFAGDTLIIKKEDQPSNTLIGKYYIGVTSQDNASYGLYVTSNPDPIIQLLPGKPQDAQTYAGQFTYFYFHNQANINVKFEFEELRGPCTLYVNTHDIYSEEIQNKLPTLKKHLWSSDSDGDGYNVKVSTSDRHFCSNCNYVLGMYTENDICEYTITAINDVHSVALRNGVPQRGFVETGNWEYFVFENKKNADIDIRIESYSGDADLYISVEAPVTQDNAKWSTADSDKKESIKIYRQDEDFMIEGFYYIGVFGFINSRYSLVVYSEGTVISLIDGVIQTYALSKKLLRFQAFPASRQLECEIHANDLNLKPEVYGLYEDDDEELPLPSSSYYQFKYDDPSMYDPLQNTLQFVLEAHDDGRYILAIQNSNSNYSINTFTIFCSSRAGIQTIKGNSFLAQTIDFYGESSVFQIEVPSISLLVVNIIPCVGDFSLEISKSLSFTVEPSISITYHDTGIKAIDGAANGTYYLRVQSQNSHTITDRAMFQIYAEIFDTKHDQLEPGNNGRIMYYDKSFNWQPAHYEDRTEDLNVQYRLFYTKKSNVRLNTVCAMDIADKTGHAKSAINWGGNLRVKYEVKDDVFVGLYAVDMDQTDSLLSYAVYNSELFEGPDEESGMSVWLILLIVFACVLVVAGGVFLYFRMRKRTYEEGYELASSRISS